jgi:hypothetical protein
MEPELLSDRAERFTVSERAEAYAAYLEAEYDPRDWSDEDELVACEEAGL